MANNKPDTFAGLWIQNEPDYKIIIRIKDMDNSGIIPYVENSSLESFIEYRTANISLKDLHDYRSIAAQTCEDIGIRCDSATNIKENLVELYVIEPNQLEAALQAADVTLPACVDVIKIDEFPKEVSGGIGDPIYGGVTLNDVSHDPVCTAGFSVVDPEGVKGVTTAAHCEYYQKDKYLEYDGIYLSRMGEELSGPYDIAWHWADFYYTVKN